MDILVGSSTIKSPIYPPYWKCPSTAVKLQLHIFGKLQLQTIDFENLSFMCGCTLANFQSARSNQDDFESFMCAHARYNRIQTCMNYACM